MPRRPLVTERHVLDAAKAGRTELVVPAGALVTALARDAARAKQVKLVEGATPPGNPGRVATPPAPPGGEKTLALGCDHAGFDYKAALKAHAESLGWAVTDVGTDGEDAVDYPDFAFAVARLVQSGGARYGLMLDGVGVGSAMVCNKVPGVRAALCPDVFSAFNARAHNDANVLTLGTRTMGVEACKRVLAEFLATPFEGGRHAARVQKLLDVEARFQRGD